MRTALGSLRDARTQQLVVVAMLLAAWELASGRLVAFIFISSPTAVAVRLWERLSSGFLLPHILATFSQTAVGFVIGFVAGIVVGNILGLSAAAGRVGGPFLTFFYSLPRIAIAPLFVIWFGIGFPFKVAFVAFVVFFIGATATFSGIRQVQRVLVDGVRVMGPTGWQLFRMTILPQEALWITTAIRLAIPLAFATNIVAEFVASNAGLGFLMSNAAAVLDTTSLLAVVVFLAATTTLFLGLVSAVERRLFVWQKGIASD